MVGHRGGGDAVEHGVRAIVYVPGQDWRVDDDGGEGGDCGYVAVCGVEGAGAVGLMGCGIDVYLLSLCVRVLVLYRMRGWGCEDLILGFR